MEGITKSCLIKLLDEVCLETGKTSRKEGGPSPSKEVHFAPSCVEGCVSSPDTPPRAGIQKDTPAALFFSYLQLVPCRSSNLAAQLQNFKEHMHTHVHVHALLCVLQV